MNKKCYYVGFPNGGYELVTALNESEAVILAQAERINKGLYYKTITEIYVVD